MCEAWRVSLVAWTPLWTSFTPVVGGTGGDEHSPPETSAYDGMQGARSTGTMVPRRMLPGFSGQRQSLAPAEGVHVGDAS